MGWDIVQDIFGRLKEDDLKKNEERMKRIEGIKPEERQDHDVQWDLGLTGYEPATQPKQPVKEVPKTIQEFVKLINDPLSEEERVANQANQETIGEEDE